MITPWVLKVLAVIIVADILLIIYAYKSYKNATPESRRATKEEIDDLFDTVDPINSSKKQGFCDYEILQHTN